MAKQPRKPSDQTETKVTRIKASESDSVSKTKTAKAKKQASSSTKKVMQPYADLAEAPSKRRNPLRAMKDYFTGAWYELRQVRWPDRKATWSMTGALLLFTGFFVVIILLLDALFKYMFQLIIG